jgi:uncharacterized membrane protein YfcA
MPPFDPYFCSEIVLLGAVIGFLSGLFGVGGGFLLTPMLSIFGVPMHVAVGSSLCQMIGTGAAALGRHWKESAVDVKLAVILVGGSVGGLEIGTSLLEKLKKAGDVTLFGRDVLWVWLVPMCCFVVLLAVIGVGTLIESYRYHRAVAGGGAVARRVGRGFFNRVLFPPVITLAGTEGKPVPLLVVIYAGVGVGVIQGFLGLGGGILFIPVLIYWIGCSTRMAIGTSLFVVVLSSIAGTVSHAFRGNVDLALVALILVSSTVGAYFGAELHHRIKPHHIRLYLSLVLLAALAVIVVKMLAEFGVFG